MQFAFIVCQVEGYRDILQLSCRPLAFTYYKAFTKDTHRKKAPSNKTPALTKSTNMGILVVGTSNQLFIRGS